MFGNFVITLALFFFLVTENHQRTDVYFPANPDSWLSSYRGHFLLYIASAENVFGSQITNRLLICFYICIVYLMLINIILPLQVQRPDSAMGTNCDYDTWYYCLCNTVTNSRACFTSEKCNVPNWIRYQDLHVHVVQCKPPLYQLS